MYLNLKLIKEKNLTVDDILYLQIIKQNTHESIEEHEWIMTHLNLRLDSYITFVKPKTKTSSEVSTMRLNKEGKDLLEYVQVAQVLHEDILILEWLQNVYKGLDKKVGNKKKTLSHIASFRVETGIQKNELAVLCRHFVEDNLEYNHVLEYMFFKPSNVFNTKFNLEESRLYNYYKDKEEYFQEEFSKLN